MLYFCCRTILILMVLILAAGRSKLLPQASGQGRKTVAVGQRVNFLPCLAHGTILDKAGHISGDILRGKQADLAQESTSTARFGTSMSAHRILGLEQVPRVRLFAV